MSATVINRDQAVEWSVASRPLPGQLVSGDLHVVREWADGLLLGVVDGLGHGDEATAAAQAAATVLADHAGEDLIALVQRCHRALLRTRGVVLTLVSVDTARGAASMLGVGNVEAVIVRTDPAAKPRRETVLLRSGVVGYQLPALQTARTTLAAGDVIVFATDGVREDFADQINPTAPTAPMVDRVLAQKFRGTDDGLVLACKYLGQP